MTLALARKEIVRGLRDLGVKEGDILMVHSTLSGFGRVEGGADTVIDALIEAVGPGGTVAMPTLYLPAISGLEVFDVEKSPSEMGEITEVFRKRAGVLRSVHPTHPVAAFGARAEELIRDHAKAPTACGKGTPFGRLGDWGGKVLLLGVDQDRNTLLHTAEDYANSPYLSQRIARYRDPNTGETRKLVLAKFPGPHRNFIGLDPLFRESGVMKIGKIGKAVCRLMDAAGTLRVVVEALKRDQAAVLCDNPECTDCVRQRGFVRQAELAAEDFTLAVRIDEAVDFPTLTFVLWEHGITAIEIGPSWLRRLLRNGVEVSAKEIGDSGLAVTAIDIGKGGALSEAFELAHRIGCPALVMPAPIGQESRVRPRLARIAEEAASEDLALLVRNRSDSCIRTAESTAVLNELGAGLAFDPSEFAAAGQNPFLSVYYDGISKSLVRQLYVKDGTFAGRPTEPGFGNGEVKELISILRCRCFDGPMVIWPRENVYSSCEEFRRLLRAM